MCVYDKYIAMFGGASNSFLRKVYGIFLDVQEGVRMKLWIESNRIESIVGLVIILGYCRDDDIIILRSM
jgi:hypothetical protein